MSNFDTNGKPISTTIDPGDKVLYYENRSGGRCGMIGIWDGEKVEFKDKEHTIVRNTNWLMKVKP